MEPAEGVQPSSERYRLPALSVMLSRQVIDYQRVWSGWRMLKSRPYPPKGYALPLSYTQIKKSLPVKLSETRGSRFHCPYLVASQRHSGGLSSPNEEKGDCDFEQSQADVFTTLNSPG